MLVEDYYKEGDVIMTHSQHNYLSSSSLQYLLTKSSSLSVEVEIVSKESNEPKGEDIHIIPSFQKS